MRESAASRPHRKEYTRVRRPGRSQVARVERGETRGRLATRQEPWVSLRSTQATNLLTMSNSTCFFVPAARFLRPGFSFLASLTRIYGVAERRESSGACEAPVGPAHDAGRPGA